MRPTVDDVSVCREGCGGGRRPKVHLAFFYLSSTVRFDMTPDEFRRQGYQAIDWIANYMEQVDRYPVHSQVAPGEIRARLTEAPTPEGESFDSIFRDLQEVILPGITHWQSPNFFAYFPANNSGPSILGELIAAGLGVQGMLWTTSPACTELETHVLDWLVELLDLPPAFHSSQAGGGVIQDSASTATLCALLAAREKATQAQSRESGNTPGLVAYTSTQAHSSIEKAMMIAGLGRSNLRKIETDQDLALQPDLLEAAVEEDLRNGLTPMFVAATVGTTSTGAVDPLSAIGQICKRHGIWLHVDGAMYGTAALCPEYRQLFEGLAAANSYCFNPHKWMLVNFDCCCFYVMDRAALTRALSINPEYLSNQASESGTVFDYRDWQVPLGRRFRALKLWFVLRSFGIQALQAMVREHVELAQEFASWIDAHEAFERCAATPLNLVTFRLRSGDDDSEALLTKLNESGKLYLTHTKVNGNFALRFCVGQANTRRDHVEAAWQAIAAAAEAL